MKYGTILVSGFCLLVVSLVAGVTRGDDLDTAAKADSLSLDAVFTVSKSVSKNEGGEFAMTNGGILLKNGRPEACFDLVRARGKDPEIVYLILFQTEKLPQEFKISMEASSNSNRSRGKYSLRLADKTLDVAYDYEIDSSAGEFSEPTIKLGDRNWSAASPRVFLAEHTGQKLSLKSVEVSLPEKIPSPSDEDLIEQLRKVIAGIARESKEVREFLGASAK